MTRRQGPKKKPAKEPQPLEEPGETDDEVDDFFDTFVEREKPPLPRRHAIVYLSTKNTAGDLEDQC